MAWGSPTDPKLHDIGVRVVVLVRIARIIHDLDGGHRLDADTLLATLGGTAHMQPT